MIQVTAAIIAENGKVLIAKRKPTGRLPNLWEFPGGKVEPGEKPHEALVREIIEELGVEIELGEALSPVVHHYKTFSIGLLPFLAIIKQGEIVLTEHMEYRWATFDELNQFDWTPADIPVVRDVVAILSCTKNRN